MTDAGGSDEDLKYPEGERSPAPRTPNKTGQAEAKTGGDVGPQKTTEQERTERGLGGVREGGKQ